jgi:hypothetical protein
VARIMRIHKIKALRGYKAPRAIAGRPSIIATSKTAAGIYGRAAGYCVGH